MRLFSDYDSAQEGEVSVLAMAETCLAVTGVVVLSLWIDTATWLAGAVSLTPVFLFRTPEAVRVAESIIDGKYAKWFGRCSIVLMATVVALIVFATGWWCIPILVLLFGAVVALWEVAIAALLFFVATAAATVRHPLRTLSAMPANWRRLVLATDSCTQPQVLPDESGLPWRYDGYASDIIEQWFELTNSIALYLLMAVYRWTVKATSLVYLPLLWLVELARVSPRSMYDYLADYQQSDWKRIRLVVSSITIIAFISKLLLLATVDEFAEWWNANGALRFLKVYIAPHEIPWWQVASAINGAIAITLWLHARALLLAWRRGRGPSEAAALATWRVAAPLSALLSIYSIGCTALITWRHGDVLATLRRVSHALGGPFIPQ